MMAPTGEGASAEPSSRIVTKHDRAVATVGGNLNPPKRRNCSDLIG